MTQDTEIALKFTAVVGFALTMFNIGAFFLSLSPALHSIAADLKPPSNQIGLPGAIYGACLGAMALVASVILDHFDRRVFFFAGLTLHAIGILTIVTAQGWLLFTLGWAFCGSGAGLLQPCAYAMISDASTDETRAKTLGRVNIGWAGATLIGVPASATLLDILTWRYALAFYLILWTIVILSIAPSFLQQAQHVASTATHTGIWSRDRLKRVIALRLHWLFLSTVFIFIGFYGVYSFLGIAITDQLGLEPSGVGLFVAIYGAGFLLGTLKSGTIDQIGHLRALVMATAGLSLILLSVPFATASVFALAGVMVLWGIFQVGAFTALTAVAGGVAAEVRGLALALNAAAVMIGASLGSGLMGFMMSQWNYKMVGLACGLSTFIAMGIVALLVRPQQQAMNAAAKS